MRASMHLDFKNKNALACESPAPTPYTTTRCAKDDRHKRAGKE